MGKAWVQEAASVSISSGLESGLFIGGLKSIRVRVVVFNLQGFNVELLPRLSVLMDTVSFFPFFIKKDFEQDQDVVFRS